MKLLPYDARQIRARHETGVFDLEHTRRVVFDIYKEEFHAQRVMSLANAVAGAVKAAAAGIHAIGEGYAELAKLDPKHGVKQVDRMLSNSALRVHDCLAAWSRFVVGDHPSIVVALDWTEFDKDQHSTLFAALVTTKGRAVPLAWRTVARKHLAGNQSRIEEEFIADLHDWLPKETGITVLADRGFAKMAPPIPPGLSAGGIGFKGSRKGTPFAAQVAAEAAARKAAELGMRHIQVHVKGPGAGRESALRSLQAAGFNVSIIKDVTPIPHNGCRPPKRRRV